MIHWLKFALILLAAANVSALEIRLPQNPTQQERTAAEELSEHIVKMTGVELPIAKEGTPGKMPFFYLGNTGLAPSGLSEEEWVIRSITDGILLAGGGKRGTLYAVAHYLEDFCGIRWWNPVETDIPKINLSELPLENIDVSGKPAFENRTLYTAYVRRELADPFLSRLRLSGDAGTLSEKYGGDKLFGSPGTVHTFWDYTKDVDFNEHPEWFSLIGDKRVKGKSAAMAEGSQLCLTNRELRKFMLERLLGYIEQDRSAAAKAQQDPPVIYAVCQNDNMLWCQCPECSALRQTEKSYSGVLIDFLNDLATEVAKKHPEILIASTAYLQTVVPPATIVPHDNLMIVLCDTLSNGMYPHSESNPDFLAVLEGWRKIAKNIRLWDYAVTYQDSAGLPYPSEFTYSSDFRLYKKSGAMHIFVEFEYPVSGDARDYKLYLLAKFMENPDADFSKLSLDFAKRYYGPAWQEFLEYREQLTKGKMPFISMFPNALDFSHLDLSMMGAIKKILDQGTNKVKGAKRFEFRWEKLKIGFYRTAVYRKKVLLREYFTSHSSLENYPYDAEIACRQMQKIEDKMLAEMHLVPHIVAGEQKRMKSDLAMAEKTVRFSIPLKFRDYQGKFYVFEPEHASITKADVRLEQDPTAESGMTCHLFDPVPEKYALPFLWGVYDRNTKSYLGGAEIVAKNIIPGEYHWYKLGESRLSTGAILFFFRTWHIQWNLSEAFNPLQENDKWEIWANMKFDGALFGTASGNNGIYVERIVVLHPN